MSSIEKDGSEASVNPQIEDRVLLEELAESIFVTLKQDIHNEEEPFEKYTYDLKLRLYSDANTFKKRFGQGYESLLKMLSSISK